jgi:hypothetical protein
MANKPMAHKTLSPDNFYTFRSYFITQLAAELIALDSWTDSTAPILYRAVTTGDVWQLGSFDRITRVITQDLELYRVPTDLATLI